MKSPKFTDQWNQHCPGDVKGSIYKQTNPTNAITNADDSDCTRQFFFHLGNFSTPSRLSGSHYIYRLAIVNSLHKQTNKRRVPAARLAQY